MIPPHTGFGDLSVEARLPPQIHTPGLVSPALNSFKWSLLETQTWQCQDSPNTALHPEPSQIHPSHPHNKPPRVPGPCWPTPASAPPIHALGPAPPCSVTDREVPGPPLDSMTAQGDGESKGGARDTNSLQLGCLGCEGGTASHYSPFPYIWRVEATRTGWWNSKTPQWGHGTPQHIIPSDLEGGGSQNRVVRPHNTSPPRRNEVDIPTNFTPPARCLYGWGSYQRQTPSSRPQVGGCCPGPG